jgi:hypothetical protein
LETENAIAMDTKPAPDPEPRPLGNESPDPFSPTLPPGSLHEILRQEEEDEISGNPTPAMDDPDNAPRKDQGDAPKK